MSSSPQPPQSTPVKQPTESNFFNEEDYAQVDKDYGLIGALKIIIPAIALSGLIALFSLFMNGHIFF